MDDLDSRVLRRASEWIAAGTPAALVTVVRTWGSAPRPPGSMMAINVQGETVGSVSGGCIEDDLVDHIRAGGIEKLCAQGLPTVLRYGISADQAHRFGLPCGGTMELVVEALSARSRLDELLQACLRRENTERSLNLQTGQVDLRPASQDGLPRLDESCLHTTLGPRARIIVIGAGDLSGFLCQIALGLGFEAIVCDPRAEHRATWSVPGVTVSQEMPDDLILRLQPDARTAVVALTHDPKLDDMALIDALQSKAFYVGAIGSRRNAAMRAERLQVHFGLSPQDLQSLHCPAGLYVGSKTPAEIALSIMAEVVAAKNGVLIPRQAQVAAAKSLQEGSNRVAGSSADAAHTAAPCAL
ncbi:MULTISPECIES: XdhC family protein [unclassified Acidovorax]|uniref:XdhC family protein n=1 Tax=unclassified Acidovorax TaxID=2684926 RepID=UPI0028830EB1|nr:MULTISPECIES: XdhC family protein [unclassified Acidovorax]